MKNRLLALSFVLLVTLATVLPAPASAECCGVLMSASIEVYPGFIQVVVICEDMSSHSALFQSGNLMGYLEFKGTACLGSIAPE